MMASHHQSRSSASSSSSSTGSAYRLILDHVMSYPGSYELPLRTMYNLNCTARAQACQSPRSNISSATGSPDVPQGSFVDTERVPSFSENLLEQINSANNQPLSLPTSFIASFVQRCFPPQLEFVDFPQALTGLDYLKDLEIRRRRDVSAAMERSGIHRNMLEQDDSISPNLPTEIKQWLDQINEREKVIDSLYSQLYVGLRRWILLNELSLTPFNKHNCVAMLNTLYPPALAILPTSKLTRNVLRQQRDGYFKYITIVEKCGTGCLRNLIIQGKADDEENAWPSIVRIMEHYLQVAISMINECANVVDVRGVSMPEPTSEIKDSRRKGKADSGISFGGSDRRPSTQGGPMAIPDSPEQHVRPKTPVATRSGTALEKIARGLMSIGRGRTEATEMIYDDATPPPVPAEKPNRLLRKMRSFGSLEGRGRQVSETPHFDADAMRKQRQKYEAAAASQQTEGERKSFPL